MKQTVSNRLGGDLSAKQVLINENTNETGKVIPVSYDKFVIDEMGYVKLRGWSLDTFYEHITSRDGNYKGVNKFLFGNTIQALKTIIDSKPQHLIKPKVKDAINFLHQDMQLSPTTIQNILVMFGIELSQPRILKASTDVFDERPMPTWLQNIIKKGVI